MKALLSIKNLHVSVDNKPILHGINLDVDAGTVNVIMGPNGSGKSSLAYTIMGHPRYIITQGTIEYDGSPLNTLSPDKRAKLGIFLAMQQPVEIEGIRLKDFLRQAYNALYDGTKKQLRLKEFSLYLQEKLRMLNMSEHFADRFINVGFSGGEKKQAEMLQLAVLQPQLAILDEIDSGLDIDALKTICTAINTLRTETPDMTFLFITHYHRVLQYLQPDVIHVVQKGIITRSGGIEIADQLEKKGYS